MDKIIGYSDDELVVKILSFLPTKVAVSTSILSKQWKFLWMRVTKLDYNDYRIYYNTWKVERMRRFIVKNLPLHRAPAIESLCLNFTSATFQPDDIKLLVEIAVSRRVREISIDRQSIDHFAGRGKRHAILPSSLYTCKSLVTLKLKDWILMDVPRVVCLPSLKTLHLQRVKYPDEESFQRLVSNCSLLEDLVIEPWAGDNVRKFAVWSPTLLSFAISDTRVPYGYVIDIPSLKYFKATGFSQRSSSFFIAKMHKLEKAVIDFHGFPDVKKLLEPLTSVKRLSLRLSLSLSRSYAEAVFSDGIVFHQLEHLKFHIDCENGFKLLLWLLKCSPKLRDFEFSGTFAQVGIDTSAFWKQVNYVPQCLLLSLQNFKWTCTSPTSEERDLATYILRKSCQLKTAKFVTWSWSDPQKNLEIKNEFISYPRSSAACNLVFDNFD